MPDDVPPRKPWVTLGRDPEKPWVRMTTTLKRGILKRRSSSCGTNSESSWRSRSPAWAGRAVPLARPVNQHSRAVISLPSLDALGSTYEVTKVDPGGTAQIVEIGSAPESHRRANARMHGVSVAERPDPLTAGCYLMLVQPLIDGDKPRLFRVEVSGKGGKEWIVQLGKAGAAKLLTGDRCSLILPHGVTPAQLRALPEVIPFTAETEKSMSRTAPLQARTLANLHRIGVALRQFADVHDFWPPAFLLGPDGNPWHSWRVLLLPYLGHRDLFDQYDFSQPWDSPKNLRLLDKTPAVFHDPIYGEKLGPFTHYAALVGSSWLVQTAFSVSGATIMKNAKILPLERLSEPDVSKGANGELSTRTPRILKFEPSDTSLIDFLRWCTNRTPNTIVVAAVSPERKIPWTKPEDITFGPGFPFQLGKLGGIAAPYSFGRAPTIHRAAPVLFRNGMSTAIPDTIDPPTLHALLTPAGWETIRGSRVPKGPEDHRAPYGWTPSDPLLSIDCVKGRATIIGEPALIQSGANCPADPTHA